MTDRQRDILYFIEDFRESTGLSPTVREIMAGVGLKSTATVMVHLGNLERDGRITRLPHSPRSIQVAT